MRSVVDLRGLERRGGLLDQVSSHEELTEHLASFSAEHRAPRKSWMHREWCVDGSHAQPAVEIRRGINCPVVPEPEQLMRVNLEMEVRRTGKGITGVADEAEHVSSPHVPRVKHPRGIAREMRVVELVGCRVPHPEPPAAGLVPADAVDRSVRDRHDRGAERGEDVVAVVPLPVDVASERAVGIAVARDTYDGKDVRTLTERRCHLERRRDSVPVLLTMRTRRPHARGRSIVHARLMRKVPLPLARRGADEVVVVGVGARRRGLRGGSRRLRARRGGRLRRGRRRPSSAVVSVLVVGSFVVGGESARAAAAAPLPKMTIVASVAISFWKTMRTGLSALIERACVQAIGLEDDRIAAARDQAEQPNLASCLVGDRSQARARLRNPT